MYLHIINIGLKIIGKTKTCSQNYVFYAFLWVIPRCPNFICRRFGTLCLFHLHRQVGVPTCLRRWNRQSVPKRRHIKFRRRGITQKKTYSIQNTAKVWNKETVYYWICTDVVLRVNKPLYWILNAVDKMMLAYSSIKFFHIQFFVFLVVIRTDNTGAKYPPTPDTSIHFRGT
jgi:hypothetical protein